MVNPVLQSIEDDAFPISLLGRHRKLDLERLLSEIVKLFESSV